MARKNWSYSEERILIDNYSTCTIKELMDLLSGRDADAINCKVKRLKKQNRLIEGKTPETKERSYLQR